MAKLSRGNLAAQKSVPTSKVDDWNPPIVTSATSTAALMLPPKSRPLPKLPTTPSQKSITNSANSERQDSSSKKKRRRRGGKRIGDSASEVTTNPSEDVARDATPPTSEAPEVLVPASQSSVSVLPPNASAEEIRVFQNEPELYGVYASSDEGEEEQQHVVVQSQKERSPVYSPSVTTGLPRSSPNRDMRGDSESLPAEEPTKPRVGSDVVSSDENQIPAPKKMANGRFKCPVAAKYDCTQTFAQAKGARRHADQHLNAEKFKCNQCGKSYSRKDTFERHLKAQHKSSAKGVGVGKVSSDYPGEAQLNGLAKSPRARRDKSNAIAENDASGIESASTAAPATNGMSVRVKDTAGIYGSYESGTEDEPKSATLHDQRPGDQELTTTQKQSLLKKKQSSKVNGDLKRKCLSPQPSSTSKLRSRKRQRRDETLPSSKFQHVNVPKPVSTASKSLNGPTVEESEHSDVEMSSADDQDEEVLPNTQNVADAVTDPEPSNHVDMMDHEQTEESDRENVSDSEDVTDNETNSNDNGKEQEQREGEEDDEEDETDEDDEEGEASKSRSSVVQSNFPNDLSRKPKEPDSQVQRQSSMDSFVHRSKSMTTSTRASASGSRISVDVPVRSKVQSKISPHISVSAQKSTRNNNDYFTDSDNDGQVTSNAKSKSNGEKIPRTRNKGKRRALSEQPVEEIETRQMEEKTSSEDRPRATTVARRTSSVASKRIPRVRHREIVRKGKKKASESDDSEDAEKPMSKPRSKARKPAKRKAKADATEESSEDQDRAKRKKSESVANSTWREASKSGVTGKFTEKEMRILHAWRDSFCEENSMTAYEFNEMMANTASISKSEWRYGNWITKADFMQQYYEQLPYRNRRSMIRFRERHFPNADSSPWTEAHDKELRQLVAELGTKWVEIAQLMGRTQDAVSQRWRHKLNYGEKPALMGDWTDEEVKKLEEEVIAFAELKKTTPDDENLHIPWNAISKKLGNGRTAQQCSNRWRINTSKRVNGKFVKVPHNDRIPGEKVQKPRTPSKMEQRLSGQATPRSKPIYKSAERVEDSDEDDEKKEDKHKDKDDDADDESEDSQADQDPNDGETESHTEASDGDEEESEAEQSDVQQSNEDAASGSEADDPREAQSDAAMHKRVSSIPSIQESPSSNTEKQDIQKDEPGASQEAPSRRPRNRTKVSESQSPASSSTQSQGPSSSLPPTFKTPAVSRNPLRRANREHATPGHDLSLSQLHAGTQANSSAKRTTGRTNRTRVPDSVMVENRPSPQLDLRRRPVTSSSPSMVPLSDTAGGDLAIDEEEESGSDESSSEDAGTDFKSPTSFVSARDTARKSDEDGEQHSDAQTDSDSDSSSTPGSHTDLPTQAPPNTDQDSSSTFWQSVNQNLRKLAGLSQSRSRSRSQNRKGRVSLADVLRRGVAVEESGSDDDDD